MEEYTKKLGIDVEFKASDAIKALGKEIGSNIKESFSKSLKDFGSQIKSIYNDILSNFKMSLKASINEMSSMLSFSKLSSSQTRDLAFGYGFSSSEAYGYNKAMSLLGFESEEDLFYANTQELKQFRSAFEKYSSYYEELYDSGFFETMQEYQFEMASFRQEMQLQVVKFFMDNKDTIKSGMLAIMQISKTLMSILSWLVNIFGTNTGLEGMTSTDIVNKYSNSNQTNNNTNVNVNNTFNNVAKDDEAWLANAGSMTYQQVIEALKGGN